MKIAFLTQEVPGLNDCGGIGFHFWGLAQELVRRGHQVCVFFDGDTKMVKNGVELIGVWSESISDPSTFSRVAALVNNQEVLKSCTWGLQASLVLSRFQKTLPFDIIETHEYHATPFFLINNTKRCIISIHGGKEQTARLNLDFGGLTHRFLALLERQTVKRTHHRYAVSRLQARLATKYYSVRIQTVIPNPVDTKLFCPLAMSEASQMVRSPHATPFFLFVGRMEHRKGIGILLKSYATLVQRFGDKLPDLICIGDDFHHLGPTRNLSLVEYLALPEQKLIRKKVHYLKHRSQPQLVQYYRHAVCSIFPSLEEPFGNVVAEALSCGGLVIATKTSGVSQWLRDGKDALLISPTVEELSLAIEKVLPSQKKSAQVLSVRLVRSMKQSARVIATKYFSQAVVADKTLRYYKEVLKEID